MTLYRQLIIFTFILFFLLFAGTWYAKLESTRSFLIDQLESHAQDTATSLALSISPHVANKDMTTVESMVNAVFDRGYYQVVTFTDTRKTPLFERALTVKIENVPPWFVNLIPLKTPEATADVTAGWKQAGTIYIKSHPGYAYETLWKDVIHMTIWFAVCAIFLLIAGGFGLRILLKPLVAVENQADALCRREYKIQDPLPWTKEFRRVVEAMNRMTNKVREMFEEQAAQAEDLRERTYHDPLTGLGNRRYFESQVKARLDQQYISMSGAVLLVRIHDLDSLNKQKGFQAGDEFIKRIAALIQESATQYPNAALARLTGGEFGIFVPNASPWDAEQIAADVTNRMCRLPAEQITLSDNIGNVGGATYDGATMFTQLIATADLSLNSAIQNGPNKWEIRTLSEETDKLPLEQQQWKDILVTALDNRRISLDAQVVMGSGKNGKAMHLEIFSRVIQEDGRALNASEFLPLAERLNLVATIDRIVLEEAFKHDLKQLNVDRIAVNVSPASLQDESFRTWLYAFLKGLAPGSSLISFEFPEFAAVQNLAQIKEFSKTVRSFGHGIGLDHYGQSFSKLGYLQSLHPDYVKIDRAYTGELSDEENDSRFYIRALCSVAHSIDIAVIAEGVESEQQARILGELNLDAIQGYFIGKPQPLATLVATISRT